MKEQKSAGSKLGGRQVGAGNMMTIVQPEPMRERPGQRASQEGKLAPSKEMQQLWETQWQEFLKTMQNPQSVWENPQLSETAPWDDAKAFLASFEQVAAACRWPREEWVARLLPALSGEAKQAFSSLEDRDREDYGKVKAAILREDAMRSEMRRQHFRQFCCQEVEDPRRMHGQLQELCCKWLKPEKHTKEQILELLILEQFLASLPTELQGWIRASGPDNCSQAVALVEDFIMGQREAEAGKWQALVNHQEAEVSLQMAQETPTHPDKQTKFWKVLQEEEEDLESLEGHLFPKLDLSSYSEERGEMFFQLPAEHEELPGQVSGVRKGSQLKGESLQCGRNEPGEALPETTKGNVPAMVEMCEEMCKSNAEQRKELIEAEDESRGFTGGIATDSTNTYAEHMRERKPLFSRYGRRYRRKSSMIFMNLTEWNECPMLGGNVQHQRRYTGKKLYDCRKIFPERATVLRHQSSRVKENNYICPECAKSVSSKTFARHLRYHKGVKNHKCPECGKSFFRKEHMMRHVKIHTRKNDDKYPDCESIFLWGSHLLSHQRSRAARKPNQCPECRRNFAYESQLMKHQRIHAEEKHHQCSECGKSFAYKSKLMRHQKIHEKH